MDPGRASTLSGPQRGEPGENTVGGATRRANGAARRVRRRARRAAQVTAALARAAKVVTLDGRGPSEPKSVRSLFISDVHLGSLGCRSQALLQFLRGHQAERIYLVGDIIDIWMTREIQRWPAEQATVLTALFAEASAGAEVVYLLGNHDSALGQLAGVSLGSIHIARQCVHETADGRRVLVLHGDQFDRFLAQYQWLCHLAARGYQWLTRYNQWLNRRRDKRDRAPVDICLRARERSKRFSLRGSHFERALADCARSLGCSAVICGHVHRPETRALEDVEYWNTGDWVEHASAVIEHHDGRLELVQWTEQSEDPLLPRRAASSA